MSLELVIEPPQCLLLTDDTLMIKSRLFLIGLIVPSPAFSCQWASVGTGLHVAVMVRHWQLLLEVRRSRCSQLYVAECWMVKWSCPEQLWWPYFWMLSRWRLTFLGPWSIWKRLFKECFSDFQERYLECKDSDSIRVLFIVEIFRCEWSDGRSTLQTRVCLRCKCKIINTIQKTDEDMIFLCENSNWAKPQEGEGRKFTTIRWYGMRFLWVKIGWKENPPFSLEKKGLFVQNSSS